ncbi:MAG: phosphatidylglycerol lysyltransferase domain-containing protein [Synergistaceae bacterium]|nr:phosphatidylglycerol lysyltransferase domain-containing protein [Synergistaceae bacterium]
MRLLFKSVNLDTISQYLDFWKKMPQKSSDYSSGVLLCWERALGYQFAFDGSEPLVWISGKQPYDHYLAPVGPWNEFSDWEGIIRARFGERAEFRLVPETLVNIWRGQMKDAVEAEENRASWEYLHMAADLAELSGNKYMRKRNRVNQFRKQNPYEYITITEEILPRIAEFQREWCESYREFSGFESIERESEGIISGILGSWSRLPQLLGGAVESMGRIVAYTIAERADDDMVMIHFEKASLSYNAAYQVINREFLLHEGGAFRIVNREEDMDDPGLRDAKNSYHPMDFVRKYTVRINL